MLNHRVYSIWNNPTKEFFWQLWGNYEPVGAFTNKIFYAGSIILRFSQYSKQKFDWFGLIALKTKIEWYLRECRFLSIYSWQDAYGLESWRRSLRRFKLNFQARVGKLGKREAVLASC